MKNLLNQGLIMFLLVFLGIEEQSLLAGNKNDSLKLISVKRIWDKAPHNAFTDLMWYKGKFWCVFREGAHHVSPDGALRVISSPDGENWQSAALITSTDSDLRDAKITVTPDGQFMLSGAEALHDKSVNTHQSLVWFSDDGANWSEKHKIGDPDFWLWRTTWHNGTAYNFGYSCTAEKLIRLYKSNDGKTFKTIIENLGIEGYPNETSIVFKGDTAICLFRCDGNLKSGWIGTSLPPYTNWELKELGVRIGGPDMILLPDGRFLATVRLYKTENWHPARTSLCRINPVTGKLSEALTLPSGGDTSYAGMVLHDGFLWVSYYSSHEEKTAIYLAKIQIGE